MIARGLLERTVQMDPGDAEALGALGEALEALGRCRPRRGRATPGRWSATRTRREVLLRAGRLALRYGVGVAGTCLPRPARLADDGPEPSLRIALIWLSAGQAAAAVQVLEQAR